MALSNEWWDRWWKEDWSWEGLAKKHWRGWVVLPDGTLVADAEYDGSANKGWDGRFEVGARLACLQDYWRRAGCADNLYPMPGTDKRFTLMHLPPKWPNGTETPKADPENPPNALIGLLRKELGRDLRDTVFEDGWLLKGPDHRMQWQGAILPNFDLQVLSPQTRDDHDRIPVSVTANGAGFSGNADFSSAGFSGYANFSSAGFSGKADFSSAGFSGNAYFSSAGFSSEAYFDSAGFSGNAYFSSAGFSGNAYFSSAGFSGNAYFDSAGFSSEAYFDSAGFSGNADFSSAGFSGYAYFSSAGFSGDAYFDSAGFSRTADFESVGFSGNAYFRSAGFSGEAYFESAGFSGDAVFSGQGNGVESDPVEAALDLNLSDDRATGTYKQPKSSGWIARRSFPRAYFQDAQFLGRALFDNRDFHVATSLEGKDTFDGAVFFRDAVFHNGDLHRGIPLTRTEFDVALTPQARTLGAVSDEALQRLHRAACLSMDDDDPNRDFTAWRQAKAEQLSQGNERLAKESAYYQRLEDAFRTLKHKMEDRRDRAQEARFFKLELRARRMRRDKFVSVWDRVLSDMYSGISNFGTSSLQPLIVLFLILTPGFILVYWACMHLPYGLFFGAGTLPTGPTFGESASFTIGRLFPFGPWTQPDACSGMGQMLDPLNSVELGECQKVEGFQERRFGPGTPIGVRLLASFQSLTAIALVFLSGLAIRRRFQIN
ncbi:MAG: hypothetical protein AAF768_04920 [Pseudomonadota bacterium]